MPALSSHLSKFCPFSVHFFPTCFPYGAAVGDGVGVVVGVGVTVGRMAGM